LPSAATGRPQSWGYRKAASHYRVARRPDRDSGYLNAGIAYGFNRVLDVSHNVACPSALIGASNFFELAVAAALALFGFRSGATLSTIVGVLIEAPVMLSVVRIVLRTRGWYEHRDRAFTREPYVEMSNRMGRLNVCKS
jgi:hypothetical protein